MAGALKGAGKSSLQIQTVMAVPFSVHRSVLALPFGANPDVLVFPFGDNPDVLALPFGANKGHTSSTFCCHQTVSLLSLCRPTVPFSLFPMAQHTPLEWPWMCPTAPRVGSDLILLLAGC